jgi:mannose-1-phosphate guanylyltransferase
MPLRWLDVGSWPSFAQTCPRDEAGNALGGGQHLLVRTRGTLVASSDPHHLLTVIGGDDLIVIHTADATLVCRAADAERIKEVQQEVAKRFGRERV